MKKLSYLAVLLLTMSVLSCDSPGDATIDPPAELITDVLLTLKDSANMQDSVVARFSDPDGPTGSVVPIITGVTLKRGRTYFGSILFLEVIRDQSDSMINVTEEVRELGTQHQVFYPLRGTVVHTLTVEVLDKDDRGLPLGLETRIRTNNSGPESDGKVGVVLSHFEQVGLKNGVDRSSESDVDVEFPVTIK
jgi:hypothetical protein